MDNMLTSKKIEVIVYIDGKEFRHEHVIKADTARKQWIRCQNLGDIIAKSVLYYTDIKDGMKAEVVK